MNGTAQTQKYQVKDPGAYIDELKKFRSMIERFFKFFEFEDDLEYDVSRDDLYQMIVRTDKRKAYYQYFHDMTINECKEAVLYAYWVLKFQPITITDRRYEAKKIGECVNEAFAIYIIFSVFNEFYKIKKAIPMNPEDDTTYFSKLLYSFRYRSISIDSMILLADSISKETLFRKYEKAN